MEFWVVSVFLEEGGHPLRGGNPLAVLPDAGDLDGAQMQAVARTFNLSETTFVTGLHAEAYDVRIFTPNEELPFAGHPTIGTAWVLRRLGKLRGDLIEQRSDAGRTPVRAAEELLWFRRSGLVGEDLGGRDLQINERLARGLGLDPRAIGLEARELGRPGRLEPALADAGVPVLLVPLDGVASLERARLDPDLPKEFGVDGAYCFTATQAGRLRARGFFPGVGITEDPATGSAAAALGLYLDARLGAIDEEIVQGVEIGRPSRIHLRARAGSVEIGGRCAAISTGRLEQTW